MAADAAQAGSIGPLRVKIFRALWIASVASNVGTWMNDTATSLAMTNLTSSPFTIALVGSAASLPILILALPAGALADVLDRRRIMLASQFLMALVGAAYACLAFAGLLSPQMLLAVMFVLGIGNALLVPAWDAALPEMVPRKSLGAALTLDSIGINIGRAIGPALGGLIFAAAGPWLVFALDSATFFALFLVILSWKRPHNVSAAPTERVWRAARGGLRYVRHAPAFQAVLVRTFAFVGVGTALWALLPSRLRVDLHVTPSVYGLLVGAFGAGAIATAFLLHRIRKRVGPDQLTVASTLVLAVLLATLAWGPNISLIGAAMVIGGGAWITQMSSLNVAAQFATPDWVRGRALSVYILVFQGAIFVGATLWGFVATRISTSITLAFASGLLACSCLLAVKYRLGAAHELDLTTSAHWPVPTLRVDPAQAGLPVLVLVEYEIDERDVSGFLAALAPVRRQRLRDGAYDWGIYRDPDSPRLLVESFQLDSWAEHLRQHTRTTKDDAQAEGRVRAFHKGVAPPRVRHLVAPAGNIKET